MTAATTGDPAQPGDPARPTVADAMTLPELQVGDHTAVDRALDVIIGAHVDFLLVRSDEGLCAGVVTRTQLEHYRSPAWFSQDVRIRDIAYTREPFAHPDLPAAAAAEAMRAREIEVWPVVDADGTTLGVVTREGLEALPTPNSGPADPAEG